MTAPTEPHPATRKVFFLGSLQILDLQLDHLHAERKRIIWELERAKAELLAAATPTQP